MFTIPSATMATTKTCLAALAAFAAFASASPLTPTAPRSGEYFPPAPETWGISNFTACNHTWTKDYELDFVIRRPGAGDTCCAYVLHRDNAAGTPAFQVTDPIGVTCGSNLSVTSDWNGHGRVFSIADYDEESIIWAGYEQAVLDSGDIPDREWPVSSLPDGAVKPSRRGY